MALMIIYGRAAAQADVPQSEPLDDAQVANHAGGFVYAIDGFATMRRFVILGSDGNNYYVSRAEVDMKNAECVVRLLVAGEGLRVVEEVTRISKEGRAPRQSPGIVVLAMCARLGDAATRRAALAALPSVCRTASTLFEFVQRCKELGALAAGPRNTGEAVPLSTFTAWVAAGRPAGKADWGRSMRRAVALWYLAKSPAAVAYQVTKYSQRNGWSHADLLRLAHPDPEEHAAKRRKREAEAAEAAAAAAAPDTGPATATATATAPTPAASEAVTEAAGEDTDAAASGTAAEGGDADGDWVMVPPAAADDTEESAEGAAASEQGALAAAAAQQAAAAAAAAGEGGDAAAVALALQVADMKAIFDFLTHGTVPGQERPARRRKVAAQEAAAPSEAAAPEAGTGHEQQPSGGDVSPDAMATDSADDPAATAAAAAAATAAALIAATTIASSADPDPTITVGAPGDAQAIDSAVDDSPATATAARTTSAAADDAPAAAAIDADTTANTVDAAAAAGPTAPSSSAADVEMTSDVEMASETAAASAPAPASAAGAASLSPVMQYLVDAHRLRKDIRAPPPPPKPAAPSKKEEGGAAAVRGRRGGRGGRCGRGARSAVAPAAEAPPLTETERAQQAQHAAALASAVSEAVSLVRRHRFGHEHVGDTQLLRCPELWAAFLEVGMPLTALVRNLGRMTELGVMQRPDCLAAVTARLRDARALAVARVHPMSLLEAMCTYRNGRGARGVAQWEPEPQVTAALQAAFYLAFKNVVPSGQRFLGGLDVSGSMCCKCSGMTSVSCREAAAAMLMTLVRTEPWVKTMAFSHELVEMELRADDKLEEVVDRASAIPMGGTDCSLPILYALERRIPVDVFVLLTDNETWYGSVHPTEALRRYRAAMALPAAKLVVLAFSASSFSIADPADPGMLDVAGLDSAVPKMVADFAAGRL